ncbi:YqaE/Pmp3 family membrane protein [Idiomarina loihiensis]|uniref:YqaE/Pmp3 family membrane protein n=1 Tax=Idiomarina loihiensis TaxID=135577 RepID=UPI000E9444FA|nr:YqaE/Pmp3 family membrane protein [Idiomarina loihiensis]|tara:strand:- start:979 stop:1155 length:177 start_codon:yes stop_codon:yes gene_type:complete
MLYILAILLPPVAILLTGKIFQAIFNAVIAILHAIIAVHGYHRDKRDERIIKAARGDK